MDNKEKETPNYSMGDIDQLVSDFFTDCDDFIEKQKIKQQEKEND